ncbi:hypothetical protein [Streptomyces sp. NPDC005828]|uniref:hypothetical protein n=1 Tax=Streptomyces sp. NPDC005828 TaxID=3157071 RepID=UPI0033D1C2E9
MPSAVSVHWTSWRLWVISLNVRAATAAVGRRLDLGAVPGRTDTAGARDVNAAYGRTSEDHQSSGSPR